MPYTEMANTFTTIFIFKSKVMHFDFLPCRNVFNKSIWCACLLQWFADGPAFLNFQCLQLIPHFTSLFIRFSLLLSLSPQYMWFGLFCSVSFCLHSLLLLSAQFNYDTEQTALPPLILHCPWAHLSELPEMVLYKICALFCAPENLCNEIQQMRHQGGKSYAETYTMCNCFDFDVNEVQTDTLSWSCPRQ